jgi:hypothetical protein
MTAVPEDQHNKAGYWHDHDLYSDADADRPSVICDTNGQVALGLCKRCGKAEIELGEPCTSLPVDAKP